MAFSRITKLDRSSPSDLGEHAFARALLLFHEAAQRVPAYKSFLEKQGVDHEKIISESDFAGVPLTDKANYFSQYSLKELSWDGTLEDAKYVSKSSGSSGVPYFWPRGEEQDNIIGLLTQPLYEEIFAAREGTTLFVVSFSLGAWIAGMEFFNSVRWAAEHGTHITVVTPGIDKEEVINQIKKLAPLYSRVILAGYPPFIKDILDHGTTSGIEWKDIDLKLLFAGEAVSEIWRDNIFSLVGNRGDVFRGSINIYGMAESGVVAHETPISILLRRNMKTLTDFIPSLPDADQVTGLYQYHPLARYFEIVDGDSIVLTANAGLPLIRYSTRDNGGIISPEVLKNDRLTQLAQQSGVDLSTWQLPFIYLYGRKDLSISFYALIIYNENIKYALEKSSYTSHLSGLFTMSVSHSKEMDQQFDISVELSKGTKPNLALSQDLAREVARNVCEVNSEYAKLSSAIGDRAVPHVTLVPYGGIETVPGKKHKWVKSPQ